MKIEEQWAEIFVLAFVAIGFIFSIMLRNPSLSYLTVFLGGFIAARGYYLKKNKEPILPFVLMITGFLVGYLIGGIWVSKILILIFFALGVGTSYYLHLKKILVTFKSENFLK